MLAVLTGSLGLLSGCVTGGGAPGVGEETATTTRSGNGDDPRETTRTDGSTTRANDDDTTADGETTTATTGDDATTTDGASGDDLDLREANVTAVSLEERSGDYRFSVELYHDDDGEDGYANWWQVERLDGERLGRRKLLHGHGTRRFTRSETVSIPDDVERVVVRGHDQTHGYGGRAALVDVDGGDVEFVDQGPDPQDFPDRN